MAAYTNYAHGLTIQESLTALTPPIQVNSVTVAVGTAPVHLAKEEIDIHKPVMCSKLSEFQDALGYSDDWDKYTLCEVAFSAFSLYNIAPVMFINVLDKSKHFKAIDDAEFANVTTEEIVISGDIDLDSIKLTSGEYIAPTKLVADTDFEIEEIEADDSDTDNVIAAATVFKILNGDKIVDNKIKITYRLSHSALGGEAVESEVTVTGTSFNLPTDTIVASVTAQTGGVDTLKTLTLDADYKVEYANGEANITILSEDNITGDAVKVSYHEIDPSKVTTDDVLGGLDVQGQSSGIELIDSIYPRFSMVPTLLIAPKFSTEGVIANALSAKAQSVGGIFKAMAIVDLSTEDYKTYSAAVEAKNQKNLSDPHLIVCYPKVASSSHQFYLSSQLAALLNRSDAINNNLPYRSPSNQTLQVDSAVLADGTEVYLTQGAANTLNAVGIGTALAFSGWRFWGNENSCYPVNLDVKDRYIATRRMLNYLENTIVTRFLSQLDYPLSRRQIDSMLSSVNMWLLSLTNQGALLGGRMELDPDLTAANLIDGQLMFNLLYAAPPPIKAITVKLSYDINYLQSLLG